MKQTRFLNLTNDEFTNELKRAISQMYTRSEYKLNEFPFVSLMNDDDKELVIEHVEMLDDGFVYYACNVETCVVNDVELYDVNVSYNEEVVGSADVLGICIEVLDLIEEFTYRSPVACATITFRRMS